MPIGMDVHASANVKRQGRQAETFSTSPDDGIYAALIFGKPGAPLSEYADNLAAAWIRRGDPPLERLRVPPEDAKASPDLISEGLFSESLFGGASLVQAGIARETEARPFLDALSLLDESDRPPAGRMLLVAGDLSPRSTLRKTFEAHKKAVALQVYERNDRDFEGWVRDKVRERRLEIDPDAESLLVQTLLRDQSLASVELEKLSLYSDDLGRALSTDDIRDLVVLEDQSSGFDLIDLALDGRSEELSRLLEDQLRDASAAIPILIGLVNQMNRLIRAHEISATGVQGSAIGEKLTPRIFDRQWPAFERRLARWSPQRLFALMAHIEQIDTACRRGGTPQELLVRRLLLEICQAAAASRRAR